MSHNYNMKNGIKIIVAGVVGFSLIASNVALADGETAGGTGTEATSEVNNDGSGTEADSETPAVVPHTHQWGEWEVVDDPQCETAGEQARTCVTCGYTETAEIPAVGHVWGEWETVTEATHFHTGEAVRECENCEAQDKKELKKRAFTADEKAANKLVEKYLGAAKKYDIGQMDSCFKSKKGAEAFPSKRVVSVFKKGGTRIRWTVQDVVVKGKKCTVTAEVTHPDYYNDAYRAMHTAIKYYASYKPEASGDEVAKYFLKIFKKRVTYETTTRVVEFSLVKTDGKWKIRSKTQDLMDIATGYFSKGCEKAIEEGTKRNN